MRAIQKGLCSRNKELVVPVEKGDTKEVVLPEPHPRPFQEAMVATRAFCTTCQRTVYMGRGDDDGCPVCSTPLVEQEQGTWSPSAPPAPA